MFAKAQMTLFRTREITNDNFLLLGQICLRFHSGLPHLPCRDALESVTSLYNQVEEKLHTLVMRSNESLQHLEFLFRLRETEAKISTVLQVLLVGSRYENVHYALKIHLGGIVDETKVLYICMNVTISLK